MIIVKFHKFPMKISEQTLFFNFTHSAMYYIHTYSGFLLFSYIFTHQCLFSKESISTANLAVVDRINS